MDTFSEKVAEAITGMTEVEGKATFADGVTDEVQYMAGLELRRRQTQSEHSKSQLAVETLTSENNLLAQKIEDGAGQLTLEQEAGLEELKGTDPEAWRLEVNKIELANKEAVKGSRDEIKKAAKNETEGDRRDRLLNTYNTANPDNQLTDEVLENDIPPRILKEFQSGETTFDEFLAKATGYLTTPKVLDGGVKAPETEVDLGKTGGSQKPSSASVDADIRASYEDEIF